MWRKEIRRYFMQSTKWILNSMFNGTQFDTITYCCHRWLASEFPAEILQARLQRFLWDWMVCSWRTLSLSWTCFWLKLAQIRNVHATKEWSCTWLETDKHQQEKCKSIHRWVSCQSLSTQRPCDASFLRWEEPREDSSRKFHSRCLWKWTLSIWFPKLNVLTTYAILSVTRNSRWQSTMFKFPLWLIFMLTNLPGGIFRTSMCGWSMVMWLQKSDGTLKESQFVIGHRTGNRESFLDWSEESSSYESDETSTISGSLWAGISPPSAKVDEYFTRYPRDEKPFFGGELRGDGPAADIVSDVKWAVSESCSILFWKIFKTDLLSQLAVVDSLSSSYFLIAK